MCDFSKGFILCTCEVKVPTVHNKKSRKFKNNPVDEPEQFTWRLSRYAGPNPRQMDGMLNPPDWDLGKGLSAEYVLEQLNDRNCFDFDYAPMERDCLAICRKSNARRIEFTYRDGAWRNGYYNPFVELVEDIKSGNLKEIDKAE